MCGEKKKKKKALISPLENNELKLNYSREQRTFRWREHVATGKKCDFKAFYGLVLAD